MLRLDVYDEVVCLQTDKPFEANEPQTTSSCQGGSGY